MEQDKTKILSDLYAIRATMSVVAMNDDEAEKERGALVAVNDEQFQADKMIRESEKALGETLYKKRNVAQQQMEELRESRNEKRKRYGLFKSRLNRSCLGVTLWDGWNTGKALGIIFVVLIAISVGLSFALCPLWSSVWGYNYEDWTVYFCGILATGGICLVGIALYLFGICVPIALKDRNYDKQQAAEYKLESQQIDRELNKVTELYGAYSEYLNETIHSWQNKYHKASAPKYHRPEVDGLIKSHEQKVAEMESRKAKLEAQKESHNEAIAAIPQRSQKIVDAAVKTYPLIDFRDWENVDLLIYYFETGRADNMKEALQLVDRQRQTDQITRAIAMASKEICRTFDDSMRRLGSALSQSFGVLSRQMAQQHVELMAGMERQADEQRQMAAAQLSEIRAQTAEQRNTQAMNQALMEKISDSSLHLARQMDRQMREVHGIPV